MTIVRVRFAPNNVPTPGKIRFQARHDKDTRPIVSGRDILNANAEYVDVPVEGADIEVRPQDAGWHYVVRVQADGGPMISDTVLVPVAGTVDFEELVRYDPKAGMAYEPEPDWWAWTKAYSEGKTAYQLAVDNGFVGTEQEWLDSLEGPVGPGASDAEIADKVSTTGTGTRTAVTDVVKTDGAGFFSAKAEVNAEDFGLMGDGTDETVKFQAFVDYLTANQKKGVLPASEYRISAPINFNGTLNNMEGWGLRGMGMAATTILQTATNVPIFRIGVGLEAAGAAGCRMWDITDMTFRYQTHTNAHTAAYPIVFVAMCYQFKLDRLFFYNGSYGHKVNSGQVVPWGGTFSDLYFNKHLTGGAFDWTGVLNDGPNNHFQRIFVEAEKMAGPIFVVQGHNTRWDTVEIIRAFLGPQLFLIKSKSRFSFGTLKLENSVYNSPRVLIELQTQAHLEIDQLRVHSDLGNITPASGEVNLLRVGAGGNNSSAHIGHLELSGGAPVSNSYAFNGTRDNRVVVDNIVIEGGWQLTNTFNSQTAEMVRVGSYSNGRMSINLGDTNQTVTLGGPTTLYFETALTAARTVTLPASANMLHGSLTYEIVSIGAVNGSNTLAIMSGTRTVTTITQSDYRVVVAWRRNASGQAGWIVTSAGPRIA